MNIIIGASVVLLIVGIAVVLGVLKWKGKLGCACTQKTKAVSTVYAMPTTPNGNQAAHPVNGNAANGVNVPLLSVSSVYAMPTTPNGNQPADLANGNAANSVNVPLMPNEAEDAASSSSGGSNDGKVNGSKGSLNSGDSGVESGGKESPDPPTPGSETLLNSA